MLAIVGPTASGKTALALQIAESADAEIVSIDSAAVYRGMDIGTSKPTAEERARVPHHMIDIAAPNETLTVAQFQKLARETIEGILRRGRKPVLVGGSGLYFRAVVDPLEFPPTDPQVRSRIEGDVSDTEDGYRRLTELDPAAADRIQPSNLRRIVRALEVIELTGRLFSSYRTGWDDYASIYPLEVIGLRHDTPEMDRRIDERVDEMIEQGLLREVEELVAAGFRDSATSVQALGYAQLLDVIDGRASLDDAVEEIKRRTRRFARRQLMWFRADPRVRWKG